MNELQVGLSNTASQLVLMTMAAPAAAAAADVEDWGQVTLGGLPLRGSLE